MKQAHMKFSILFTIASAPLVVLGTSPFSLIAAGQHVIWSYSGLIPPEELYKAISQGHAAGVIFFGENINANISSVVASLKEANEKSPIKLPLLLMTDQEGGRVRRLAGEPVQSAKQMCGNGTAAGGGRGAGENLKSVGMNVNLAPVLDVYRVPGDFEDRVERSFSNNATLVSECGLEFINAQRATGIASTLKHFPGLGAASAMENTDLQAVTLNISTSTLRTVDELPYRAAIDAGAELVMPSWAVYPDVDPSRPSGLSAIFFRELRGRIGFRGVTISDALEAGALQAYGSAGNRGILASEAGMDLLLASGRNISQGVDVLTSVAGALEKGKLDWTKFALSTLRIENLRKRLA